MISNSLRIIAASLLALSFLGHAEEEPPAPVPDRLESDWWNYFAPEEPLSTEGLERRITKLNAVLDKAQENYSPEQVATIQPLIERIKTGLARFAELSALEPPQENATVPSAKRYTIEEALDRYKIWSQLDVDIRANREETDWRKSLLVQDRRQQALRRVAYLDRDSDDSDRFEVGLNLMAIRAELEARDLNIVRQLKELSIAEARLRDLKTELEKIPPLLEPSSTSLEVWTQAKDDASKALAALQEQIAEDAKVASFGSELIGSAASRLAVLKAVMRDLDLALAETEVGKAELGVQLVELISPAIEEPDTSNIAAAISDHRALSSNVDKIRERAARVVERTRTAAGQQMASLDDDESLRSLLEETLSLTEASLQTLRQLEERQGAAQFLTVLLETRLNEVLGWVGQASSQTKNLASNTKRKILDGFQYPIFEINETPVTGNAILRFFLILIIAWWSSKVIQKGMERFSERLRKANRTSIYTLQRLIHYAILAIGVIVGLTTVGLDLSKFALFASALGVGLGFGLQNLVSNFVAGLIILFERSLSIGDFVELQSGIAGEVREINMRSTLVTTNDNIDILVPNSEFVGTQVTNWTLREAFRRIHIPFGVAYGTNKDLVKKAVLEAADRVPWTFSEQNRRKPQVWFVNFGDSSLDFELVVWLTPEAVKRPGAVQADFLWEIETSLADHDIEVPFPQRDLNLRGGFDLDSVKLKGDSPD